MKQAWWISWWSDEEMGGFTLYSPWWTSGWSLDADGKEETVFVAAVRADSEDEAFKLVESSYDKDGIVVKRRFADPMDEDEKKPWEHEGTRFPFGDWMIWEGEATPEGLLE